MVAKIVFNIRKAKLTFVREFCFARFLRKGKIINKFRDTFSLSSDFILENDKDY